MDNVIARVAMTGIPVVIQNVGRSKLNMNHPLIQFFKPKAFILVPLHDHTFVLKVQVPRDNPRVPTVEGTWGVANWHEREAFDLYGIVFDGLSDLRRILLPDDWQGHPLRKDWEDPELYNGMRVKPTPQMAERYAAGEKIGVGPFDFTPPNLPLEQS